MLYFPAFKKWDGVYLFIILDTTRHLKDGTNSRQEVKHKLPLEETPAVSS